MQTYWARKKLATIQELAHHVLSLVNLQSGSPATESQQSRLEPTIVGSFNARNIMNVESPSTFPSLVACINKESLTPKQLRTI